MHSSGAKEQESACYWHSMWPSQHSRPFEALEGNCHGDPVTNSNPLSMRLTISFVTDHIPGATPEHLSPRRFVVTHLMDTISVLCLFFDRIPRLLARLCQPGGAITSTISKDTSVTR